MPSSQRRLHPTTIFGKYLFGGRFEIYNFRNICCKISCLSASRRIFESSGAIFLAEIDPYNFRITIDFQLGNPNR